MKRSRALCAARMAVVALITLLMPAAVHAGAFAVSPPSPPLPEEPQNGPRIAARVRVDGNALAQQLAQAPQFDPQREFADYAMAIDLPTPTGELQACLIAESSVMEPGLQARYPQIRSYVVQSLDQAATGRLTLANNEVSALLRTSKGTWLIDPAYAHTPERLLAYWQHDLAGQSQWTCHTSDLDADHHDAVAPAGISPAGVLASELRTFRIAIACTGEYGVYQSERRGHSPNVADAMAEIVAVLARVNVVYENDLGVHFDLVASNDTIVYTDPATDPYSTACSGSGGTDCSFQLLDQNVANVKNVIGVGNFDIGHLLTRVFGGVAYFGSVCGNSKAGGISGMTRGGDVNDLAYLVVVHEIGHQFGAGHSFSGTRGRCLNNGSSSSAWEAGSGSSPMAYAGGCPVGNEEPTDNVALFADPFFHHGSIQQMDFFLSLSAITACSPRVRTGNAKPEFTSAAYFVAIPPSTPFELLAAAQDINNNALTYSWEQFDSNVFRPLTGDGAVDNGAGSLFRIFPPVPHGSRSFPRILDVLSGVPTPGERLPSVPVNAARRFRCIVRDNEAGKGGVRISNESQIVIADIPPFVVTQPSTGQTLSPGTHQVTWNVGGTATFPVLCSSVELSLSRDGGESFSESLGSFPNTGTAQVRLPGAIGNARLKVKGNGNVFFNVTGSFSVSPCPGDFDASGMVNTQDIFAYLAAWFAGDPVADINNSAGVSVQDIFDFLAAWFATCG